MRVFKEVSEDVVMEEGSSCPSSKATHEAWVWVSKGYHIPRWGLPGSFEPRVTRNKEGSLGSGPMCDVSVSYLSADVNATKTLMASRKSGT